MKINTWVQSKDTGEISVSNHERIEVIPGVWINGKTYWLTPGVESMIPEEGISVHLKQEEETSEIKLYHVSITNYRERHLNVKLLIQNRHYLSGNELKNLLQKPYHLSFISPSEKVVFHLDHDNVYLANGCFHENNSGISTIQSLRNVFTDNIWNCQRSGKLKYNPMANGDAVSLFIYDFHFKGKQTLEGKSWVITGKDESELVKINETLLKTH
ncbi:hypothetical protein [Bacillus sp. S/N-304-OC-R1]|uniref:hypothetical protein n=1 Tax=Bacillus sp. S/N-304-OC-R1 TaxID=2758034 RepID=UPI001C8D9D19|nr:hypothetical protein [Bacillus sp. S/N-304-OC-R1]MBY0122386.1 hypothetical protein [Bacillus sp. S/N-304-OC-R1]